ncbi:13439_t:CDS:1, partial [Acaulospora morrowiae]
RETQEQTATRRSADALRHRRSRQEERADNQEMFQKRAAKVARIRTINATRARNYRQQETEDDTQNRRSVEAEQQRARCQTQTPEEAILERVTNANRNRQSRYLQMTQLTSTYQEALSFTNSFPDEVNVGKMDVICDACGALHFAGERTGRESNIFSSCCQKGAVVLEKSRPFPDELKALFEKSYPLSSKFL